jgi:hypothetical protein
MYVQTLIPAQHWYTSKTKLELSLRGLHWTEFCDEALEEMLFFYVSSNPIQLTQWQRWDQIAAYVNSLWFVQ